MPVILRFALLLIGLQLLNFGNGAERQTFVIVHGAWGGSWAFKEVAEYLEKEGHKVVRPALTGLGECNHLANSNIDLSVHITDVVNTILWEDLHDVILVGHSYGGMVITGVADQAPNRIRALIYLDALLPENGESVEKLVTEVSFPLVVSNGFILPVWVKDPNAIPRDVPQPIKTFTEPVRCTNGSWSNIPSAYLLTVDPGKEPSTDFFYRFYERAKQRGWLLYIMEADHNPQRSKPQELSQLLLKISGSLSRNPKDKKAP